MDFDNGSLGGIRIPSEQEEDGYDRVFTGKQRQKY